MKSDKTPTPDDSGERLSLLRMSVAGQVLAVPIDDVREILQYSRLTPLPRTPSFLRGVMNLRGAVVPVIDLAARLGFAPATPGRRSCVVIVDSHTGDDAAAAGRLVLGLLVDAVYEVFDVQPAEVEPVPALGTRIAPRFLAGMTRARGQVLALLALAQVLQHAELEQLIAGHDVAAVSAEMAPVALVAQAA